MIFNGYTGNPRETYNDTHTQINFTAARFTLLRFLPAVLQPFVFQPFSRRGMKQCFKLRFKTGKTACTKPREFLQRHVFGEVGLHNFLYRWFFGCTQQRNLQKG
jgi:hypothetical protein